MAKAQTSPRAKTPAAPKAKTPVAAPRAKNLMKPQVSYDDFTGTQLDPQKWAFLEMPTPDGSSWKCEEPKAKTQLADGTCTITVKSFERSHDVVQLFDNPKHLLLSTQTFPIASKKLTRFSVDMAAKAIKGQAHDYRDGFAAFNVLNMTTGCVFDIATTGDHVYAIHEQLPLSPKVPAFLHMVENPLLVRPQPGEPVRCTIEFDKAHGRVRWLINDLELYRVEGIGVPDEVSLGLGLLTLHPIHEGKSRSVRGQGLTGAWSRLTIE